MEPLSQDLNDYTILNEIPQSGDMYVYIPPAEWQLKEEIKVERANWPDGWMDKCWDRDNYHKVVLRPTGIKGMAEPGNSRR